ncbi:MAG: hypothetical protein H0W76_19185 [Pyrinomonadaceae bacterium]|nr:hypothetical protein [Pyrinomonadaceae bacterium]
MKTNRIEGRSLPKGLPFVQTKLALMLLLTLLASSCGWPSPPPGMRSHVQHSSPNAPPARLPPIERFWTTLEDEVRDIGDDRIRWSTYWKLCWEKYPEAIAYELQTITGEGSSSKLRRQSEICFRLEVAAGENKRAQGLLNREEMLGLQEGQLSYRVRAMFSNNGASEWSLPMAVGKATSVTPQTKR